MEVDELAAELESDAPKVSRHPEVRYRYQPGMVSLRRCDNHHSSLYVEN